MPAASANSTSKSQATKMSIYFLIDEAENRATSWKTSSATVLNLTQVLPKRDAINVGDIIIGFPSNGIYSNGHSLIRKIMDVENLSYIDVAPFSPDGKNFAEEFLRLTKIYVKEVLPAIETCLVKALAHITGGGMWENIPRVLRPELTAELQGKFIRIKQILGWLLSVGNVEKLELMETFNCGIGMIILHLRPLHVRNRQREKFSTSRQRCQRFRTSENLF